MDFPNLQVTTNIAMKYKASVIFTTYNQPKWLEKALWGYEYQSHTDFEIIIADDGSGPETRKVIEQAQKNHPIDIKHIWHPDEGYQKCPILNKAILASEADYLIFSDGDCIPRKDFVETHLLFAQKGYFLSGGMLRLPLALSQQIAYQDISSQDAFKIQWLWAHGFPKNIKISKLVKAPWFKKFMNTITPTNASWNGHNASAWKADILAINGFNEDMHYGGQDREFGERLFNYGIQSKQIRYSAVCLHLEHGRPYKTKESIQRNKAIRKMVKTTRNIKTPNGIEKIKPA
jgi:glycosyltransferase involved in cell wall biosynthesis